MQEEMTMASLFDPGTYADVRRPLLEAGTLPPACYTSTDFYQQEVSSIFMKCWNLISRADVVKNPGDYFTHTLVGVSLIIMRGEDGKIRAFVNSCRHRGAKILQGEGNCKGIRCPYHSWLYSTLGELRNSNGMQDTLEFSPEDYGLLEVRLDIWCGFLFVNLDPNCISLSEYLGDLGDYTHSYEFDTMVTVKRRQFSLQTNWKNYIENSMESFHLPTVHQKTIGGVKAEWATVVGDPGNYVILQTKTKASRATLGNDAAFERIATLSGPAAEGAQYILIYPCTVIGADFDCMWFKQMAPDGPGTVRYSAGFCFPKASYDRPDFEQIVSNYHKRFELVISEDNEISELQMEGLSNPFARAGRLSSREPLVHAINNWILDHVVGPAPIAHRTAAE
jgi:phenylpropionate dioxygenase-like ring-hydroxylating dioxygenase large terminal subunit